MVIDEKSPLTGGLGSSGWRVLHGGTEYGPYTYLEMASFVDEKRVVPSTKVQHPLETKGRWEPADSVPALRQLLANHVDVNQISEPKSGNLDRSETPPKNTYVVCPNCGKQCRVPEASIGLRIGCPKCRHPLTVPQRMVEPQNVQAESPKLSAVAPKRLSLYCPHCHIELSLAPESAGETVSCPSCSGRFQAPLPKAATVAGASSEVNERELNPGIKICVLISGIADILLGVFWITTICGVVIGVPQIILGIFEITFFSQVDGMPIRTAKKKANNLGILEIISGLFNLVSLVCGILVLIFVSKQRD